MKKAVVDTSALISLALSNKLELVSDSIAPFIPQAVKQELEEISKFDDMEGKAAKALTLARRRKISLTKIKNKKTAQRIADKNIDFGELNVLYWHKNWK